ncbi:MAG TPA: (Fe-S)-binding protein [Gemmatimonadales bacterium]|nr:(Fe-S)-binding protein [Gemmatimonadales bacterium]
MRLDAAGDFAALDPCVHCGFCLPACPTYLATGDEADSPRGRIVLMRALERGELPADDPALIEHLDACLGCRGCEPACPSGVGYGRGLEAARDRLYRARQLPLVARVLLGVFAREAAWRPLFTLARGLRATGIPRALAGAGRLGFGMGMLAASGMARWPGGRMASDAGNHQRHSRIPPAIRPPGHLPSVALFRGCIMDTLFGHVHDATRRTLEANGYEVVDVKRQVCCGALHEHAGDRATARALAARNVAALADAADYVVVNSAGCGALLKDYGHLLGTEDAARLGAKVRDVSELLAERGPRPGTTLDLTVAYDAPCHLQHAQRVHAAPLAVLNAIPGLRLRLLPGSDRCCGSAGIYSLVQPALSQRVLADKIRTFRAAALALDAVATGNPGCVMQIGAGLRAMRMAIPVLHPVELLDRSYAEAGMY